MAAGSTRRMQNAECFDTSDPNRLPIVSGKEGYGGQTTVVTAVLIDGERAWFDEAATHGRTALEQGLTWVKSPDEVPEGRRIDIVWLFIKPRQGQYEYHGVTASHMIIDEKAKRGYKYLADHANQLGRAIKGEIDLSRLDERARRALLGALNTYPEALAHSSDALKEALGLTAAR